MARFDRTIPPGGEGKITLKVRTKGYQGGMHKKARVSSNDPEHPLLTIAMKGKVWTPIHVNPRYVRLNGVVGKDVVQVVHLRGEKKEPLSIKLTSVSIPDKVAVDLKETEKGKSFQLSAKNKVEEEGRYTGEIKLTSNYPERSELTIRVLGNIRAPVEARPKTLNFGRMSEKRLEELKKRTKRGMPMTRPIMVILHKSGNLEIEKTELESSLFKVARTRSMEEGRMVQVLVEAVLEKLKKGVNTDQLKIYTNQEGDKVLEVPIRFEIM